MSVYDSMNELERLRKRNKLFTTILICAAILPFLSMPYMWITEDTTLMMFFPIIIPVSVITVIVMIFKLASSTYQFKALYKKTFVSSVLNDHFSNVMYDWTRGFSENDVKQFGLSKLGNRFRSEDYLSATYNDIKFQQADVTIEYESGSDENSSTTTYFKGRMLAFEFPKNNITSVQLHSKKFKYPAKNPFGYNMRRISMESDFFNKTFDVTSANEHDAFYVLTPHLMESIQKIYEKYKNVEMHFTGNNLYVGINGCNDTFDAPSTKKLSYPVEQERIRKDIQDIMDIIDTMTKTN